jgi:hypothetical protein
MLEPAFPAILRHALAALRHGEGETRSEGRLPAVSAGFDSLYVAGRRSSEPVLQSHLSGLDLPVVFSRTPDFPGREAGLRLLDGLPSTNGWVCDLGQTSLKISHRTQCMTFARDMKRLPLRTDGPGESIPQQRCALREWLVDSLRTFSAAAGAPDSLLVALPSRLDDSAIPEGSSYIGMANDGSLIADVINTVGGPLASLRHVRVMNDAELASLDAIAEPTLRGCAKTLVITIGFGVGAALVFHREGRRHA